MQELSAKAPYIGKTLNYMEAKRQSSKTGKQQNRKAAKRKSRKIEKRKSRKTEKHKTRSAGQTGRRL